MSEYEEIIEDLIDTQKLLTGYRFSDISKVIERLRTLQPHDNADLVKVLNGIPSDGHNGKVYRVDSNNMGKIITALSQPLPFDVLAHLRGGGKVHRPTWDKGNFIHIDFGHDEIIYNDGTLAAHSELAMDTDWQPYEDPLEDGLYFVEGDCSGDIPILASLKNGLWAIMGEDGGHFAHVSNYTPITNPATNAPWRIETPEDT